jgi:hypothetical protein
MRSPRKRTLPITFSNVVSVSALCIALIGTTATIYYNFFWVAENLSVSIRYQDERRVGRDDSTTVNFVFTNGGKQAAIIETVTLLSFIDGADPTSDGCSHWDYVLNSEPEAGSVANLMGPGTGRILVHSASRFVVNNQPSGGPTVFVGPYSATFLSVTFGGTRVDKDQKSTYHCFGFRYFDSRGNRRQSLWNGWWMFRMEDGGVGVHGIDYFDGPFQLLPENNPPPTGPFAGRSFIPTRWD